MALIASNFYLNSAIPIAKPEHSLRRLSNERYSSTHEQ